jgi:lysophospholipase L1-like esterase
MTKRRPPRDTGFRSATRKLPCRRSTIFALFLGLLLPTLLCAADAPFAKEIAAFEQADRKAPPPKDGILFVGSSTIRFWTTLAEDFPKLPVINRGFGGSQVADSVRYADRIIIPYHPRQIVLYAGDNDLAAGKSPQQVLKDFSALVDKVHAALPEVPIDFISIKPSLAREKLMPQMAEANKLVEEYSKSHKNVGYIDVVPVMVDSEGKPRKELFRPDGLHMNREGYKLWVPIIAAKIQ